MCDTIHRYFFKSLRRKNAAAFFRLAEPHRRRRGRQLDRSIAVLGDSRRDDAQQIVILGPLGEDVFAAALEDAIGLGNRLFRPFKMHHAETTDDAHRTYFARMAASRRRLAGISSRENSPTLWRPWSAQSRAPPRRLPSSPARRQASRTAANVEDTPAADIAKRRHDGRDGLVRDRREQLVVAVGPRRPAGKLGIAKRTGHLCRPCRAVALARLLPDARFCRVSSSPASNRSCVEAAHALHWSCGSLGKRLIIDAIGRCRRTSMNDPGEAL